MIRVTIELVPGGIGKPRVLHVIEIWNTLARTLSTRGQTHGDYAYRISRKFTRPDGTPSWHKTGDIERFPRAAKNSAHLLLAVLQDAYGPKEKTR